MPQVLTEITSAPDINVNVDIQVSKTNQDNVFTVELNAKAAAQTAGSAAEAGHHSPKGAGHCM